MSGVFIASLGHSGSTLLDLMLGSHPRLVSLGEVHATITRFAEPQNVCTCGKGAAECAIWGPIHDEWRRRPDRPYAELRAAVVERVHAVYGRDVAPVDSSKHLPALRAVDPQRRRELKVIFLVKDVRSFVASAIDRDLPWRRRHRNLTLYNVMRWHRGNRNIKAHLKREAFGHFTVGYEELCFRTGPIVRRLCDFLDLPFHESMVAPAGERAHILRGNRMRFDRESRSALAYDARWMTSARTLWAAPWFLPVMGLNRRLVYSNLLPKPAP